MDMDKINDCLLIMHETGSDIAQFLMEHHFYTLHDFIVGNDHSLSDETLELFADSTLSKLQELEKLVRKP